MEDRMNHRTAPTWTVGVFLFIGACVVSPSARAEDPIAPAAPAAEPVVAPAATPTPTPAATPVATGISAEKPEFIGAETCLNCHEAQGNFKSSHHARGFEQLKKIAFDKSCETCHGPGSLHAAAAGDRNNPGFSTVLAFKNLPATQVNASCLECHQESARLHWTGGVHESKGVSCINCHSVHSPAEPKASLIKKTEMETCYQCHKDVKGQMRRTSHMPIIEGKMSCSSCHQPHGSATPKMVKGDSPNTMCLSCHADKRGPFLWSHPPVMENCMNCHSPHGSHHDRMLITKQPLLCQRCHNASRHPSTPYGLANINNQQNMVLNQSCMNCHANIHGSSHPSGKFFIR